MADTITTLRERAQAGLRSGKHSGPTGQFMRFFVVGGVGYVTNVVVFAVLVRTLGAPQVASTAVAYVCGWIVALVGHRHWTFGEREASVFGQGARYLVVSVIVYLASLGLFTLFVGAGIGPVIAWAIALLIVTPLSFGLNRLWAFRADRR